MLNLLLTLAQSNGATATEVPVTAQEAAAAQQAAVDTAGPTAEAAAQGGWLPEGMAVDPATAFDTYGIPAIKVIIILVIAYLIASWASAAVVRGMERSKVELTLARFFGKLTRWAIMILAILSVLSVFGVQTTSFAAVIGASALAIGLAFQGTLANFAAGVMLLIFRPFKVGDVVSVSGQTGKVFEIDLCQTSLDTPDNRRIIVPNGQIFGSTIENISHHERRRCDVAVGCDYSADIDQTRDVLMTAAKSVDGRCEDEEPMIVLLDLGDSSVNWAVRVWVPATNYWPVRDALTRACKMHLDQAGIGIPFPQMDVHLDKVDG